MCVDHKGFIIVCYSELALFRGYLQHAGRKQIEKSTKDKRLDEQGLGKEHNLPSGVFCQTEKKGKETCSWPLGI
jgi:hypothetical protein